MDQEFGRDDDRGEEARGGVKEAEAGLFSDVGDMSKIPGHQIVDLVDGGDGDMYRISEELALKYAALDVSLSQDGYLLANLKLF